MVISPLVSALPTPGLFGEEARTVTGRVFPEASETNDYVGINDAVEGLKLLEEENPDLLTYQEIGDSYGWDNAAGGHDEFPVFAVTVTNEESDVEPDDKLNLLFMLSIHGNEKGGREGGVRVVEDFVKAANGEADTGIATPERADMLDYTRLIFLFPNPDGWAHENAPYRHNDACYVSATCPAATEAGDTGAETQNFVRVNGNGTDLNRQAPTEGWSRGNVSDISHSSLREPESRAYIDWLETNFDDIDLASDLHGMLYPANALIDSSPPVQCVDPPNIPDEPAPADVPEDEVCLRKGNFVLTLLPAAGMTPAEEQVTTALAEDIKQRLNSNPEFREWNSAPEAGAWGGQFNDWGTVWDTIGYVDSGFSSDFFAQEDGLDAPGVDFEFAYNHITFDNYYPGVNQRINAYHIEATRTIVASFMDFAQKTTDVHVETNGRDTAFVPTEYEATSADNDELTDWAAANPADDAYDWANGGGYNASPNQYFVDHSAYLVDGESNATFTPLDPTGLGALDGYDNLVIPGSAAERILDDEQAAEQLRGFVEDGGNLVLTDRALELLAPLGVVDESDVQERIAYAGHTDFEDREHPLADGVRGLARQLYEPVPLGFSVAANGEDGSSPVWTVNRTSFEDAGGTTVGTLSSDETNLGQTSIGDGQVTVIGALLPNPSEEFYHPYGVADYATTYTGNEVLRNALGYDLVVDQDERLGLDTTDITGDQENDEELSPGSVGESGDEGPTAVPAPGIVGLVAALGAALALLQRRR